MPTTHNIRCRCGKLRGIVQSTTPSNHCICYCRDCQAFARHLGAKHALDEHGGTHVIQVPASNVSFTQGSENLACLRLTGNGLLRWYSSCCRTPIGNTVPNWRVSFFGLIQTCLGGDGQSVDASFGPATMRVNVKGALGRNAPSASGLASGVVKILAMVVKARISGEYRNSPLFDLRTGSPVVQPIVLTPDERRAADQA